MKKIVLALVAVVLFTACKKEEDHGDANLHIKGHIKGLSQGRLYIQKIVDTSLVALDTIIIQNDKAGFESYLKIDSPQVLYLFLDRGQTNSVDNSLPFFAEPGKMTINSYNEEFFKRAKITGSKNQKLWDDYLKIKNRFVNDNLDLIKEGMFAAQYHNLQKLDSVEVKKEKLEKSKYLYTINFAVQHADHEIAPYLMLTEAPNTSTVYLEMVQKKMTPKVAKSIYGKILNEFISERRKSEAAQ